MGTRKCLLLLTCAVLLTACSKKDESFGGFEENLDEEFKVNELDWYQIIDSERVTLDSGTDTNNAVKYKRDYLIGEYQNTDDSISYDSVEDFVFGKIGVAATNVTYDEIDDFDYSESLIHYYGDNSFSAVADAGVPLWFEYDYQTNITTVYHAINIEEGTNLLGIEVDLNNLQPYEYMKIDHSSTDVTWYTIEDGVAYDITGSGTFNFYLGHSSGGWRSNGELSDTIELDSKIIGKVTPEEFIGELISICADTKLINEEVSFKYPDCMLEYHGDDSIKVVVQCADSSKGYKLDYKFNSDDTATLDIDSVNAKEDLSGTSFEAELKNLTDSLLANGDLVYSEDGSFTVTESGLDSYDGPVLTSHAIHGSSWFNHNYILPILLIATGEYGEDFEVEGMPSAEGYLNWVFTGIKHKVHVLLDEEEGVYTVETEEVE